MLTGLVVLLAWIPLRQRPGIGTGANIVVIAVSVDAALALGWLLGGTVGLGTVLYALAIGPLTQLFLPRVTVRQPRCRRSRRVAQR